MPLAEAKRQERRVGLYCWGGPNTIDMYNLKFFHPKIDETDLLRTYDYDYIKEARDTLGLTDLWVMFSWGFDMAKEEKQYEFLAPKIANFKALGLKVHAYIQGPNRAQSYTTNKKNIWARNPFRQRILYHRSRFLACINKPAFLETQDAVLERAFGYDFDGIYMDNMLMGQVPLRLRDGLTFFGCDCYVCRRLYREKTGKRIPYYYLDPENNADFYRYRDFRIDCTTKYIKHLYHKIHSHGMEFGWNSLNGIHSELMTGVNYPAVKGYCDYFMFENHSLPGERDGKLYSNKYLEHFIEWSDKPVFILSYKRGIGLESEYQTEDIRAVLTESKLLGYSPLIKGTEYTTNGIWHNLHVDRIDKEELLTSSQAITKVVKDYTYDPIIEPDTSVLDDSDPKQRITHKHIYRLTGLGEYALIQILNHMYYRVTVLLASSRLMRFIFMRPRPYLKVFARHEGFKRFEN